MATDEPDLLAADEPDCLTIGEVSGLLGITVDAARKELSRLGIPGEVHYSAAALRKAVAGRPGRGNWAPPSDLYALDKDTLGHWWRCAGCRKTVGGYASKRSAKAAAERHHDKGSCSREFLEN